MKKDGIEIQDYLDAKEERIEAIKKLRNIVFDLLVEWHESLDDHPTRINESVRKRAELLTKITYRMHDYEALMWDFKKDWQFNEQECTDYGLN